LRQYRKVKPDLFFKGLKSLPGILKESDFLVNTLPLTPKTRGLIGLKELKLMRPEAFLINVSRGFIIDEDDLRTALKQKVIAGALLDVFDEEPLPPTSPLYTTPDLIVTPHVSGVFAGMVDSIVEMFRENLELFMAGKPLYNVVGRDRGY
jgi:D-2-hydroxyacid dehydrogenase (NADP+)